MLNDLFAVWFPRCCWNCNQPLAKGQEWLCLGCCGQLPKTYFEHQENNPLQIMLRQYLPLESAYAPYYFLQNTPIQALLHALKYQGKIKIGEWLAVQCESFISKEHKMLQCDGIVPVPLHQKRERKRGYNQVTPFGRFWANRLGVPYLDNILQRNIATQTLVRMSRDARWTEVKNAFSVQTKNKFKHLLLVDDVITTGATLTACGNALLQGTTEKISVLGMAYAQNILP